LKVLNLHILEVGIRVLCQDPYSYDLLARGYSAFIRPDHPTADLNYTIIPEENSSYQIILEGRPAETAADDYELLYMFEKSLTMEIQLLRQDLLFMHAGALEYEGRVCLLVAPSGSGKSTTTWALLNNGFRYLSDELAPIDLATLEVHIYPHALCLKAAPPEPFQLPAGVFHTSHTIHVPVEYIPAEICIQPYPLAAVFFLRYDPSVKEPTAKPVSKAGAAARIYSNALNLLAHERYGLDAALKVADQSACFELITCDLQKTCDLVKSLLRR